MLEATRKYDEMKYFNNFSINAVNSHGIEDVDQILIECQLSYFNVVSLFTDDSNVQRTRSVKFKKSQERSRPYFNVHDGMFNLIRLNFCSKFPEYNIRSS